MDSLHETNWDVILCGTDLRQSLLALALSRSKQKILHLDKNDYYAGPDAAFSLQEAQLWVEKANENGSQPGFKNAYISLPEAQPGTSESKQPALSFSRAYSLSLSPQIIYSRSELLAGLVASKVYRQLEFLALGSWWVYGTPLPIDPAADHDASDRADVTPRLGIGKLKRVPSSREDVFADTSIDLKGKRSLMKFLKFVGDYENQSDTWEPHAAVPFSNFLKSQFALDADLQAPLLAISMSSDIDQRSTTAFAVPRVARHLRSMGLFGPGFGAVIPKWGGGAEIAQVACRAAAVGGTTYMLDNDVARITKQGNSEGIGGIVEAELQRGEKVKSRWIVRSGHESLQSAQTKALGPDSTSETPIFRSISVVSSSLTALFPSIAEGAPQPAGAVVVFPSGSLATDTSIHSSAQLPPVHIIVHSSDTGECAAGQCVLYSSVKVTEDTSHALLDRAVQELLDALDEEPHPTVLCTLRYTQSGLSASPMTSAVDSSGPVLQFPPPTLDLVFDDGMLEQVKAMWEKIKEDGSDSEFLTFEERQEVAAGNDDD